MLKKLCKLSLLCITGISLAVTFNARYYRPKLSVILDQALTLPQVKAFLDVIAYAEGTYTKQGYNIIYSGQCFYSYKDHPRKYILRKSGNRLLASTAAGRYQILSRTWDNYAALLNLYSFSPANQDKIALMLIRQMGALHDVIEERFEQALAKVARIWASLPGACYGQRTIALYKLTQFYRQRLKEHKYQVYYKQK